MGRSSVARFFRMAGEREKFVATTSKQGRNCLRGSIFRRFKRDACGRIWRNRGSFLSDVGGTITNGESGVADRFSLWGSWKGSNSRNTVFVTVYGNCNLNWVGIASQWNAWYVTFLVLVVAVSVC